ncbi:hypothetical protein E2493_09680 [Sphingomonas parva]|uniref:Uncharacterized protein n=1 Tax=Sphingomonas parva TaxID=2555898 RepID=A0A4Y8ZRA8_9SPHN|nr:hypothetical protein [Sphingomonas parva]TFI58514.1 hypothetical protein E2493_09680 [Sphingomonas parva]
MGNLIAGNLTDWFNKVKNPGFKDYFSLFGKANDSVMVNMMLRQIYDDLLSQGAWIQISGGLGLDGKVDIGKMLGASGQLRLTGEPVAPCARPALRGG